MENQLNSDQAQLVTVSFEYERAKATLEEAKVKLEEALSKLPVNSYFQEPFTGIVYKIVVPKGRFIYFDKLSYERTKLVGETKGSLSIKEAQEQGFYFEKNNEAY